jgi:hypothetical protein
MIKRFLTPRAVVLAGAVLVLGGCDSLFEVTNPGPIEDSALDTPAAMPGLVAGMSSDLSVALSDVAIWSTVWADELGHSGTLGAPTVFAGGIIPSDDVDPAWRSMQRARWVAEHGIERMKGVLGSSFEGELGARANLLAGFANRLLGEQVCHAVIDGGPAQPYSVHFERADGYFTEALRIAKAIGNTKIINAATGGRASVRAALGRWDEAVADASLVPIDFRYDAVYSLNTGREQNGWNTVTITRGEYSVFGSPWAAVTDDPRVPWESVRTATGAQANAANGRTPWLRQLKYRSDADNIALSRGTEMLLIRAEAALRASDVAGAMGLVNQERASYGLGPLSAATPEEAWPILRRERGAVLWLEARRFWDLRRWHQESGPVHDETLKSRDRCVPIGRSELLTNPNL